MAEDFKVLVTTQSNSCHFKLMGYSEIGHILPKIMRKSIHPFFGCGRAYFRKAYTKSDGAYSDDKVRRKCRNWNLLRIMANHLIPSITFLLGIFPCSPLIILLNTTEPHTSCYKSFAHLICVRKPVFKAGRVWMLIYKWKIRTIPLVYSINFYRGNIWINQVRIN